MSLLILSAATRMGTSIVEGNITKTIVVAVSDKNGIAYQGLTVKNFTVSCMAVRDIAPLKAVVNAINENTPGIYIIDISGSSLRDSALLVNADVFTITVGKRLSPPSIKPSVFDEGRVVTQG
jgi:hypothetical protein